MGHQSSWLSDPCFFARSGFVFHLWKENKKIEQICSNMILAYRDPALYDSAQLAITRLHKTM